MQFLNNIHKLIKKDYDSCLINALSKCYVDNDYRGKYVKKVESIMKKARKNNYTMNINRIRCKKGFGKGMSPLAMAIKIGELRIVKLIIEYALDNNISLNINETENDDICGYPFLQACSEYEIAKLLIKYANEEGYTIEINKKDIKYGNFPLLHASDRKDSKMIDLIINYVRKKNIILNMNGKDNNYNYPLLEATKNRNVDGVKALLNYADKNSIILRNDEKDRDSNYPLLEAVYTNSYEIVKSLLEYSKKNNIVLKFDEKDLENNIKNQRKRKYHSIDVKKCAINSISEVDKKIIDLFKYYRKVGTLNYIGKEFYKITSSFCFIAEKIMGIKSKLFEFYIDDFLSMLKGKKSSSSRLYIKKDYDSYLIDILSYFYTEEDTRTVESILKEADENHYIMRIDKIKIEKGTKSGMTPLSLAINVNKLEVVNLLIEYARKHHIDINVNETENDSFKRFPFLWACGKCINPEIAKFIINYANDEGYIIDINKQDDLGNYPLLKASKREDSEMIELIINYANSKDIILNMDGKSKSLFKYGEYPILLASKNRNIDGVKALLNYADKNSIILRNDEKDRYGNYPLLEAVYTNSYEIVKSLLEYSKKNNIVLNFDEKDLENNIKNKRKEKYLSALAKEFAVNSISEVDNKIISLLNYYRKVGTLNYNGEKMNKAVDDDKDKVALSIDNFNKNTSLPFSTPTSTSTSIFLSTPQASSLSGRKDQNTSLNNNRNGKEKSKEENNENRNEINDLAVVLYDFNGTNSDELILHKDDYLIVTNWNIGDGWAFGYKRNDPQKKGKFPYPLVRKCSENEGFYFILFYFIII